MEIELADGIGIFIRYHYWFNGDYWVDQKNFGTLWKKKRPFFNVLSIPAKEVDNPNER